MQQKNGGTTQWKRWHNTTETVTHKTENGGIQKGKRWHTKRKTVGHTTETVAQTTKNGGTHKLCQKIRLYGDLY